MKWFSLTNPTEVENKFASASSSYNTTLKVRERTIHPKCIQELDEIWDKIYAAVNLGDDFITLDFIPREDTQEFLKKKKYQIKKLYSYSLSKGEEPSQFAISWDPETFW